MFWLDQPQSKDAKPDEDGKIPTRRDTYLSVERQTGITPPELELPPLPADVAHVWRWFTELDEARGSGGMSASAITFPDILAWKWLTDRDPTPGEVRLIRLLDRARLKAK